MSGRGPAALAAGLLCVSGWLILRPAGPPPTLAAAAGASAPRAAAYTHLQPDGNRWMPGRGTLPATPPIDVPLRGIPRWVVAAPLDAGAAWVVILADGRAQAFALRGRGRTPLSMTVTPARLPEGMPPALEIRGGRPTLLTAPGGDASRLTHAVHPRPGTLAYVAVTGDLVLGEDGAVRRLAVRALPDARLLADPDGRLLLLTHPTGRYLHGVLGDALEAAGVTLVAGGPRPRATPLVRLPDPEVIEGLAPIWADLLGDRRREIVVTVSDPRVGARLHVLDEAGATVAMGPPIGRGMRWRHQIAVAPFGLDGARELAAVRTPHIGGVVEFYRLAGGELRIVAEVGGYTSHLLGSRNLDMAAAGDFDGDGRVELLLPDQGLTTLGAIRRTDRGAAVAWTVPLGGRLSTNLAAVQLAGGGLAVGAGREDRVLRLWLP